MTETEGKSSNYSIEIPLEPTGPSSPTAPCADGRQMVDDRRFIATTQVCRRGTGCRGPDGGPTLKRQPTPRLSPLLPQHPPSGDRTPGGRSEDCSYCDERM